MTELPIWRALYRVAHSLRYRELPELIGKRVVVASVEGIDDVLRALASPWIANDAALHHAGDGARLLLKFGRIDAWFEVSKELLDHDATIVGLDVMRECYFLPKRDEQCDRAHVLAGASSARELADDVAANRCYLKLMLRDETAARDHIQFWRDLKNQGWPEFRPGILADYLPRELDVLDACVTNSRWVWLESHLYGP